MVGLWSTVVLSPGSLPRWFCRLAQFFCDGVQPVGAVFLFAKLPAPTEPAARPLLSHLREERLHRKPPDRLKKHRQLWRCCRSHCQEKVGPPPGLLHPGPGPDAGHQLHMRPQPTRQPPTRDDQ